MCIFCTNTFSYPYSIDPTHVRKFKFVLQLHGWVSIYGECMHIACTSTKRLLFPYNVPFVFLIQFCSCIFVSLSFSFVFLLVLALFIHCMCVLLSWFLCSCCLAYFFYFWTTTTTTTSGRYAKVFAREPDTALMHMLNIHRHANCWHCLVSRQSACFWWELLISPYSCIDAKKINRKPNYVRRCPVCPCSCVCAVYLRGTIQFVSIYYSRVFMSIFFGY